MNADIAEPPWISVVDILFLCMHLDKLLNTLTFLLDATRESWSTHD